jgi:hypothetical protein
MDFDDIKKYGLGCGVLMLGFLCFIYMTPFLKQRNLVQAAKTMQEQLIPNKTTDPTPAAVSATAPSAVATAVPSKPQKTPAQILEELSNGKDQNKFYELAIKYYREGTDEEKLSAVKVLPSLNMRLFEEACANKSDEDALKIYNLNLEISQYCAKLDEKKSPPGLKDSIRHMNRAPA